MSDGNSGMHLWTIFIHDLSIRQIVLLGCPLQFFFFVISILYHLFVVSATINPSTILKSFYDLYASAIER